uniref:Ig-like domain-containing protein n=1 Tax=Gallus gallus TaxID=9031 RepID=A0A8V0XNY5_CHICK
WGPHVTSHVGHLNAAMLPRPSLSLHPSQRVSLGDTVTLRCHLPLPAAWVWLYLEGRWSYAKYIDKKQDTTEFSFRSASHDQAGTYLCQYQVSESEDVSVMSDPVELVLTGEDTGTVDIGVPWEPGGGSGEGLCCCPHLCPRHLLCHRCPQPLDTER